MSMDRRQFVRAAGGGFAVLGIPSLLAGCRKDQAGVAAEQRAEVVAAAARGRSLLVLYVEDDPQRSGDLGSLFGTFLLHALDEEVAPLATVDLAGATPTEMRELAPVLFAQPETRADLRAVLILPDGRAMPAVRGDPPPLEWGDDAQTSSVHERHLWLARELSRALPEDPQSIDRAAAAELAAIGAAPVEAVPSIGFAERWPNQARAGAVRDPARRAEWIAALAAVARERWIAAPPPGSTWAESGGCGVRYDTPPPNARQSGVACGMGHVPEISRRFLHFYTAEERNG